MTDQVKEPKEQTSEVFQKRPYHSPQLVLYGDIRELTHAAAPSTMMDNPAGPAMSK